MIIASSINSFTITALKTSAVDDLPSSLTPSRSTISAMKSPFSFASVLFAAFGTAVHAVDSGSATKCVATSPTTGLYYDLSSLTVHPPPTDPEKSRKHARDQSWHAKGYDYPANFTLNICAPVIEDVRDVVGVEEQNWRNVSAYYQRDGRTYSIGFVARKLSLN